MLFRSVQTPYVLYRRQVVRVVAVRVVERLTALTVEEVNAVLRELDADPGVLTDRCLAGRRDGHLGTRRQGDVHERPLADRFDDLDALCDVDALDTPALSIPSMPLARNPTNVAVPPTA